MKLFFCKSRLAALAIGVVSGVGVLTSCGGGSSSTSYQLSEGEIYHFIIGPATSVDPEEYLGYTPPDQLFSFTFVVGANLHGQIIKDGSTTYECIYSLEGDLKAGQFDLDISWNTMTSLPANLTLTQVHLPYGEVNGTITQWRVMETVSFVDGTRVAFNYYGTNGVINRSYSN